MTFVHRAHFALDLMRSQEEDVPPLSRHDGVTGSIMVASATNMVFWKRYTRRSSAIVLLAALFATVTATASAAQKALLVAVGDYPGIHFDLYGPANDANALRRELVENLGFRADRVDVLVDADATRANILAALRKLAESATAGDFIFVYFSGHGTSAYDPNVPVALAHNTGAFVPFDYQADGAAARKRDSLVVGSRDLRPHLTAIDRSGAHGLVMIDSCYSRNTSRSLHTSAPPVYRAIDAGIEHLAAFSAPVKDNDNYPYARLVTMAASSAKEVAIDLNDPSRTLDGKPHGAFTDAVLRALREFPRADANGDALVSNREFFAKVKLRMALANIPHSPQLLPTAGGDTAGLGGHAVFGSAKVPAEPPRPLSAKRLSVRVEGRLPLVAQAIAASDALALADGSPDLLVRRRGQGEIHILTPFGDALASVATEQAAANALRQQPWIRHLVESLGQRVHSGVELGLPGETFEEGDVLDLATTLRRSAHLLVVDIAPSGGLRVLYPASPQDFRAVPASRPIGFSAVVNAPFGVDYMVASVFPQAPSFFDERLLEDAEIAPGTLLHRELVHALEAPGTPSAVAKVVTVPRGQIQ